VSGRPSSNLPRSRRAAKRFRHRRNRLARRLLDEAYAQYLSTLPSNNNNNDNSNNHNNDNNRVSGIIVPVSSPPPPPPPPSQSPPLNSPSSPPRSPTPPIIEPDSPHSALTQRIFPDSPPPSIRSFSPPSYSSISSPELPSRPVSPLNSTTSSVEFIEEIYIPPPRPNHYYYYNPHQSLDTLISQFPQRVNPLPPDSYSIGPDNFDLAEIRTAISGQDPNFIVPVFLPTSPFPYDVPVRYFYNLFPPSTVRINELAD